MCCITAGEWMPCSLTVPLQPQEFGSLPASPSETVPEPPSSTSELLPQLPNGSLSIHFHPAILCPLPSKAIIYVANQT